MGAIPDRSSKRGNSIAGGTELRIHSLHSLIFFHGIFARHDANDPLGMLNTWQLADVSKHGQFGGDWQVALSSTTSTAIVLPSKTDLCFPPEDNEIEVAMMPNYE